MAQLPSVPSRPLRAAAFDYDRTVSFSDNVLAIALTLLVLSIGPPKHAGADLMSDVIGLWPEVASYAVSFVVVAMMWVAHHQFFRSLARIDGAITGLNLAYLGFITFLPFPTSLLGDYGDRPGIVILYAAVVSVIGLLEVLLRVHARRAGLYAEGTGPRPAASAIRRAAVMPAVFLASAPLAFISPAVCLACWAGSLALRLSMRRRDSRREAALPPAR